MKKLIAVALAVISTSTLATEEPNADSKCETAVATSVYFMTSAYGVAPRDVRVQIASAVKQPADEAVTATAFTGAGDHKCVLTLKTNENAPSQCKWVLHGVDCDNSKIAKIQIIDEPAWVQDKEMAEATRNAMRESLMDIAKQSPSKAKFDLQEQ